MQSKINSMNWLKWKIYSQYFSISIYTYKLWNVFVVSFRSKIKIKQPIAASCASRCIFVTKLIVENKNKIMLQLVISIFLNCNSSLVNEIIINVWVFLTPAFLNMHFLHHVKHYKFTTHNCCLSWFFKADWLQKWTIVKYFLKSPLYHRARHPILDIQCRCKFS